MTANTRCDLDCGIIRGQNRIRGGTETRIVDGPWNVFLRIFRRDGTRTHCGATIISGDTMMTAAHCIPVDEVRIIRARVGCRTSIGEFSF